MARRVLLLYNTPKARRYFNRLAAHVPDVDIRVAPLLVGRRGPRPTPADAAWAAEYSLRRKRARYWIPDWRMRLLEGAHLKAARGHYAWARSAVGRHEPDAVGVWGGQAVDVRAARAAAGALGVPAYVFETGTLPDTTTCDPRGVNHDSSVPRTPDFYAHYERAAELPGRLQQRPACTSRARAALPRDYVFVPFQVPLDSQVLLYSPWIRDMRHLFTAVVEAWRTTLAARGIELVFKTHPGDRQAYPDLHAVARREPGIRFADGNSAQELIDGARGVITINSTVGIEALLRQRPVIALGRAFYAIPGVADAADDVFRLAAWLASLGDGTLPRPVHRQAFLSFLARDYCIPDHHERPGPDHGRAIARRLSDPSRLVPAGDGDGGAAGTAASRAA